MPTRRNAKKEPGTMQRQAFNIGTDTDQKIPPMLGMSVTVKSIIPEDVCVKRGGVIISENKVFFLFALILCGMDALFGKVSFKEYGCL